jgi:hypothetical protein
MKRSMPAIILIASLVFYQYGRVLNYVGCRINNIVSNTAPCDCEKKVKDGTNTDSQPFSQKSAVKINTEDLFFRNNSSVVSFIDKSTVTKLSFFSAHLYAGYNRIIFQPPRA